jgi:diadenosine tetraphosphate (Ap4A) HIT family hydrolase
MSVLLPTGASVALTPGVRVELGREHAVGEPRAYVSRSQLTVWLEEEDPTKLHVQVTGQAAAAVATEAGAVRMTTKTGDAFVLHSGESVGLYGTDEWVLFTHAAGGDPAPSRDSGEARPPSAKRLKSDAPAAQHRPEGVPVATDSDQPAGLETSVYSTRALLTRAYAPPPKPPKPEGLDALARLVRDPAWALKSGRAFHVDEKVVVAYDLYAKARVHLLILPLQPSLQSVRAPTDLRREHLPAIRELRECAAWLERSMRASGALPPLQLRVGFHRVPSMAHLHIHLVTADFDSEALKTKRQWNSFQSPFFLPLDECLCALEASGVGDVPRGAQLEGVEAALKADMSCSMCRRLRCANIPALKEHLGSAKHASAAKFCSD